MHRFEGDYYTSQMDRDTLVSIASHLIRCEIVLTKVFLYMSEIVLKLAPVAIMGRR